MDIDKLYKRFMAVLSLLLLVFSVYVYFGSNKIHIAALLLSAIAFSLSRMGHRRSIENAKVASESREFEKAWQVDFKKPNQDLLNRIPPEFERRKAQKGFSLRHGFVDVVDFVRDDRVLRVLLKKDRPLRCSYRYNYGKGEPGEPNNSIV